MRAPGGASVIRLKPTNRNGLALRIRDAAKRNAGWPGYAVWFGFLDGNASVDFVTMTPGGESSLDGGYWDKSVKIALSGEGKRLWERPAWMPGSPHGSPLAVWNMDDDANWEVITCEEVHRLRFLDGETGAVEREFPGHPVLKGGRNNNNLIVANLRGTALPRDLVINRGNKMNHTLRRLGDREDNGRRYRLRWRKDIPGETWRVAGTTWKLGEAPAWLALDEKLRVLWSLVPMDEAPHYSRAADLDGDGRDEIVVSGNLIVRPDGTPYFMFPDLREKYGDIGPGSRMWGQLDGLAVGDFRPDVPGLEIVMGGEENHAGLAMLDCRGNVLWYDGGSYRSADGEYKAAYGRVHVGDFVVREPGSETIIKRPPPGKLGHVGGVYDSRGKRLDVFPSEGAWFHGGSSLAAEPEVLDWDGDPSNGREVAVNLGREGEKGSFVLVYSFAAAEPRLLFEARGLLERVGDVIGDGREELLVMQGTNLVAFTNPDEPRGAVTSPWEDREYALRRYVNAPFHY